MPNTRSAKKAVRQSERKRKQNSYWRNRVKQAVKNMTDLLETDGADADIIEKEESLLYKVVDKAAKKKVISKSKASRIKSKFAKRASAYEKGSKTKKSTKSTSGKSKSS